MRSLHSRHRIAWTMPVLVALPFLMGADGPGCGGVVTIGSGVPTNDGGSGTVTPGIDAATGGDSATCACPGPAPSAPNTRCPDGSTAGPICAPHTDGTCSWAIRSCPSDACPALGCFPSCPNGTLKDSSGCDTCRCAPGPDAGGGACTSNADCTAGYACGYLESEACKATGTCVPMDTSTLLCASASIGCGCDGSPAYVPTCPGLPTGYLPQPIQHRGPCTDASTSGLTWYWTCGDPVCQVPDSDAGLVDDAGAPCPTVGSSCTSKGETCGTRTASAHCGAIEQCDDTSPAVTCPVSSRRFKDDIKYVDDIHLQQLHDEAVRIRLATYNYRPEVADPKTKHLGFIIEDDPQSPAVEAGQRRVDMYGYVSMVVAAMQVQEKEIAELRRELDLARAGVCESPGEDRHP
jgi:hypothetical protein